MSEFKEYPKRLYPNGPTKPSVLVNSAEEEATALGAPPAASASKPVVVDRKALIAAAKAKGVKKANFLSNEDLITALGDDYPHLSAEQEAALDRDGDSKPGGAPKGGNKKS